MRRRHVVGLVCLGLVLIAVAQYALVARVLRPQAATFRPPSVPAPSAFAPLPVTPQPIAPPTLVPTQPPLVATTPITPTLELPIAVGVIERVETKLPYVAISVDDFFTGDYRWQTAIRMLEAANAAHVPLTLCPAGRALAEYMQRAPDQAARIKQLVDAGSYELCNHSYTHVLLPRVGVERGLDAEVEEITRGTTSVYSFFGRAPGPVFRPPFGSWDESTIQAAAQVGYRQVVTWSLDSGDSEGKEKTAQQLVANVACAQPGDIILLHANRRSSAAALPLILAALQQKGLQPVALSTLLGHGEPVYSTNPADIYRLRTCAALRGKR